MAGLRARCGRSSGSGSATSGTTGRPVGSREAGSRRSGTRAVWGAMGHADRRCRNQVDDSEVPPAPRASTWSECAPGRGLSAGAACRRRAGYGKTAVLASWAAGHGDPLAWLSCDPSDAEPTRFMSGLLSAIAATLAGCGRRRLRAAGAGRRQRLRRRGRGGERARHHRRTGCDRGGRSSSGGAGSGDCSLRSSRRCPTASASPPLPGRTRRCRWPGCVCAAICSSCVATISASLRARCPTFFALHDVRLTGDELRRLHELTEGWPAGAQLAAIALQRGVGPEDFLNAFAGTDRAVSDFLVSEVLAGLPPDARRVPRRDVGARRLRCRAVRCCHGHRGVGGIARPPVRRQPVRRAPGRAAALVPLPPPVRGVSPGAAGIVGHHEAPGGARSGVCGPSRIVGMTSARCSRPWRCPTRIVPGRIVRAALGRSTSMPEGTDLTVRAIRLWLHEFGAATIETDPAWVVELLIGLITLSDTDDGPAWLERVRSAHPRGRRRAHRADRDGVRRAPPAPGTAAGGHRPPVRRIGSDRRHPAGPRPALASPRLDRHVPTSRPGRRPKGAPSSSEHSPTRSAARSPTRFTARASLPSPRPSTASSRAPTSSPGLVAHAADQLGLGSHEPGRIFADLALVEVHLERNDHEAAARILHRVTQATEATHRPTLQSLITLYQAKVARVLGDEIGAEALLGQARRCYAEPDAAVRQTFGEEAVAQALRFDPSKASRLIAELDQDRVGTQVLRARLALVEHDDRAAAGIVGRPAAGDDAAHPRRAQRAVRAQRARARRRTGQPPSSRGARRRPARAADPHRRRPGARRPPPAAVVHARTPARSATSRTCSPPPAASCHRPGRTLRRRSSNRSRPREVIVLRYLCSRLTYREIAAALYVSLNTLKSHVRSVYRKLAVASRADAVDLGRCQGLI